MVMARFTKPLVTNQTPSSSRARAPMLVTSSWFLRLFHMNVYFLSSSLAQ